MSETARQRQPDGYTGGFGRIVLGLKPVPESEALDLLDTVGSLINANALSAARSLVESVDWSAQSQELQGRAAGLGWLCAFYDESQVDSAADLLSTLDLHQKDRAYLLAMGAELADQNEYDAAARVFGCLCEVDPTSHIPLQHLALALECGEQFEEALDAYDKAIKQTPEFAPVVLGKARCQAECGQFTEAVESYERYLELRPDDAEQWLSLAVLLGDIEEHHRADQAYEAMERIGADPIDLYYNWAVAAASRNDLDRLLGCLSKLEEKTPDTWETVIVRALQAELEEQTWQAWELCKDAWDLVRNGEEEGDEEDLHEAASCADAVLGVAARNDLREYIDEFVEDLFAGEILTEGILDQLRGIYGTHSERASDFLVELEGKITEQELIDEIQGDDNMANPPYGYFRYYRVWAESADQATELVEEFEDRCGGNHSRIEVTEIEAEPEEENLGVWYRSTMHVLALDETEDGGQDS